MLLKNFGAWIIKGLISSLLLTSMPGARAGIFFFFFVRFFFFPLPWSADK